MTMSFVEHFKEKYYKKLLQPAHPNNPIRDRATSFLKVFEELEKKEDKNYIVVETGCMRPDHGEFAFGDDGCSTYIFDDFINYYDGLLNSVDIEPINAGYANSVTSDKTTVHCMDSVKFLWSIGSDIKIDFLYLDSFDIIKENPHPSQMHHLKELCAVTKNLKRGSVVVVDDHDAFFTEGEIGKGTYVAEFMKNIGAKVLFEEYQIGWVL